MFSLKDVAEVLGVELTGADVEVTSVSTDTRTLEPGALFVALDGERFQGSDFIGTARQAGAAAVLSSQADSAALPGLVVENTTVALGQLAAHWRNRFDIPVIGVTGSNGKTTVREMIAAILAESGEVLLVEATPDEHRELTRFTAFQEKTWNSPALATPYLLVRNDREAACFELPVLP